ncbi:MAG TPA: hypothetical protein VNV37_10180 [Solirubrobacteraceae bacterium]|jgi:hypothetical protein|nr:hypothetical protein [Solirubrobacteraceae bacterium]
MPRIIAKIRTLLVFVGLVGVCAWSAVPAGATITARLSAALTPERLGGSTTIVFGFTLATTGGQVPPPLTGVDLYYPANLGIGTSGLGLETCSVATLEADGIAGCPSQSQMGYGTALVEIPFGPAVLRERTRTRIFMAQLQEGHLGLLFFAEGASPVAAQIVFHGLVLPAPSPFGGDLATSLPLVPTLPGAPNAAVVYLRSTIGPLHLIYYERLGGRYRAYHPRGIVLPLTCPRGGFRFAASFAFEDGSHASAATSVPCPR